MLTGLVDPKLKVGKWTAPTGLLVMAAVKVTVPVNPPVGARVTVEVLFVVAPGTIVTGVLVRVSPGGAAAVTATEVVAETIW